MDTFDLDICNVSNNLFIGGLEGKDKEIYLKFYSD